MDNSNYQRIISKKSLESYPEEVIRNIKLMSIDKDKLAEPFGSYTYRIQKYPGDIDLVEEFYDCCTPEDVAKKFAEKFKKIVKDIISLKMHYISDIKAGIDYRYDEDIGILYEGVYIVSEDFDSLIEDYKDLFSEEEIDKLKKHTKHEYMTPDDYDIVNEIFREHLVLRWTPEEILSGKKQLIGNEEITLEEAVTTFSHIKLDMITVINQKFVEITNFFALAVKDANGKYTPINVFLVKGQEGFNKMNIDQLKIQIEKLFYSNKFFNPFKMIKRMWALARQINDREIIYKLVPFISGETSHLYQIKSEIDTILNVYEKAHKNPSKTILKQLQNIKNTLSTINILDSTQLAIINGIIDEYRYMDMEQKILFLHNMKDYLTFVINYNTEKFMHDIGMIVPPRNYLPDFLSYINEETYTKQLHGIGVYGGIMVGGKLIRGIRVGGIAVGGAGKKSEYSRFLSQMLKSNKTMKEIGQLWREQKIQKQLKQDIPLSYTDKIMEDIQERDFLIKIKDKLFNKLFLELFNPVSNLTIKQNIENEIQRGINEIKTNPNYEVPILKTNIPIPPPPPKNIEIEKEYKIKIPTEKKQPLTIQKSQKERLLDELKEATAKRAMKNDLELKLASGFLF